MGFLKTIDICDHDELVGHVAFLEEAWFAPTIRDMIGLAWLSVRDFFRRMLGRDRRGTFNGGDVSSLRLPTPLMKRMNIRAAKLRSLSRGELRKRFIRQLVLRSELSSRRSADEDHVAKSVLHRSARLKGISTDLASTSEVERKLFVRYVVDHLSELQKYFISVGHHHPEVIKKLIRDAIGGLSDPAREAAAQVAMAEEMAWRALSGLMHAGVIVGATAVIWTLLLLGVYAAVALVAGMSGGLVLPAIIIGVIFVVNRRFNNAILMFEIVLMHARFKQHEMDMLKESLGELSADEQQIASLQSYIEELHQTITSLRHEQAVGAESREEVLKRATIVVLGEGHIGVRKLSGIAKERGLAARNLEFIGYEKLKRFNIERLRWSACDGIIVGEVPHSARGAAKANLIEALKGDDFPPVEICRETGGDVKLTKTSFEEALDRLIERLLERDSV